MFRPALYDLTLEMKSNLIYSFGVYRKLSKDAANFFLYELPSSSAKFIFYQVRQEPKNKPRQPTQEGFKMSGERRQIFWVACNRPKANGWHQRQGSQGETHENLN